MLASDLMQSAAAKSWFLICKMGVRATLKSGQKEVNVCKIPGTKAGREYSFCDVSTLPSFTSPGISEPTELSIESLQLRSWSLMRNHRDRLWQVLTILHDIKHKAKNMLQSPIGLYSPLPLVACLR